MLQQPFALSPEEHVSIARKLESSKEIISQISSCLKKRLPFDQQIVVRAGELLVVLGAHRLVCSGLRRPVRSRVAIWSRQIVYGVMGRHCARVRHRPHADHFTFRNLDGVPVPARADLTGASR